MNWDRPSGTSEKTPAGFAIRLAVMLNAITHHSIWVLDQDEALDFYVGWVIRM